MKSIGLISNPTQPGMGAVVDQLATRIHQRGIDALIADNLRPICKSDARWFCAVDQLPERADMIVAMGGDGTLLRAAAQVHPHSTPILGVNLGRLGFLSGAEPRELDDGLDRLLNGDYAIEERIALHAQTRTHKAFALNEVVIERSVTARLVQVVMRVGDAPVLFDDSRSMSVSEYGDQTRAERFVQAYRASGFEDALARTHRVVRFRFGENTARVNGVADLGFDQAQSDIAGAVRAVIGQMAGAELSAVVVFSDGVQQSDAPVQLMELPGDVPVFAVGTGRDDRWRDLALVNVSAARVRDDEVAVTARVVVEGMAGEDVRVETRAGGRVVASSSLAISGEKEEHYVRLKFQPKAEDWRVYRVQTRLADTTSVKDRIAANNARDILVDQRARVFRILYFSGRPNWEGKFLRRALDGDRQLALSSLLRISGPERKFVFQGRDATMANPLFEGFDDQALNAPRYDEAVFIRIGVSKSALASGYPSDAAELFRYDLVIWGDIERDFFSLAQLNLTREFVSKRGGSFLMLGGPRAYSEGGWARSSIEPLLPIALGPAGDYDDIAFRAKPTIDGLLSGVWSLGENAAVNNAQARLDRFPLWHRPPFYILLAALLCMEWYLRRKRGEP